MSLILLCKRLGRSLKRIPIKLLGKFRGFHEKFRKFLSNNGMKTVETRKNQGIKFVGVTLNSFRDLEIYGNNITMKLLTGIWKSGINLKRIETVVITKCTFSVSSEEFCNFLKNLSLKTLEITEGTFSAKFLNDEMLRIPTEFVKISSEQSIRCLNITSDIMSGWVQQPNKLLKNFLLQNVEVDFKLSELLSVIKQIEARPNIGYIDWSIGVLYYTDENDATLLNILSDQMLTTNVSDDDGMRKYEKTASAYFGVNGATGAQQSAYFGVGCGGTGGAGVPKISGAAPPPGTSAYFAPYAAAGGGAQSAYFQVGRNPAGAVAAPAPACQAAPAAPTCGASTMTAVGSAPGGRSTMTAVGAAPARGASTMTAIGAPPGGRSTMTAVGAVVGGDFNPAPAGGASTMTAIGAAPAGGSSTMTAVGVAPGGRSTMTAVGAAPAGGASTMTAVGAAPSGSSTMTAVGSAPAGGNSTMTAIGAAPGGRSTMTAVGAAPSGASTMTAVGAAPAAGSSTMTAVGAAPAGRSTMTAVGAAPGGASTMTAVGAAPAGRSTMTAVGGVSQAGAVAPTQCGAPPAPAAGGATGSSSAYFAFGAGSGAGAQSAYFGVGGGQSAGVPRASGNQANGIPGQSAYFGVSGGGATSAYFAPK